jgi:hypothetical protein
MSDHGGLTGKRVLIFAANGRLASAAARHFAAAGAEVLLSGRNQEAVEAIATQIAASGGKTETAVVDPTSPPQVRDYLTAVAGHGPVDVVFNGVGMPGPATGYGIPYDGASRVEQAVQPGELLGQVRTPNWRRGEQLRLGHAATMVTTTRTIVTATRPQVARVRRFAALSAAAAFLSAVSTVRIAR